jgi:hypothetical protein
MQTIPLHRFYQVSGIIAAILLALLFVGTATGRTTLAWIYLQSTETMTNATHIHTFSSTGWTQPARSACSSTQPQEAL